MNHADVLKLLCPVNIEGDFAADAAIEGLHLDTSAESATGLVNEIYPDQAYETLTSWERIYILIPTDDATIQSRRDAVIQAIRARGGLSRAYFIALAAIHGWTITIDEFFPSMTGWSRFGDYLMGEEYKWLWRINASSRAIYQARAGVTAAGERLLWWLPDIDLENFFNRMKPAHTVVVFNYT